jgi:hypothetical protein
VEIKLGHGELVLVGKEDAFGRFVLYCCVHMMKFISLIYISGIYGDRLFPLFSPVNLNL